MSALGEAIVRKEDNVLDGSDENLGDGQQQDLPRGHGQQMEDANGEEMGGDNEEAASPLRDDDDDDDDDDEPMTSEELRTVSHLLFDKVEVLRGVQTVCEHALIRAKACYKAGVELGYALEIITSLSASSSKADIPKLNSVAKKLANLVSSFSAGPSGDAFDRATAALDDLLRLVADLKRVTEAVDVDSLDGSDHAALSVVTRELLPDPDNNKKRKANRSSGAGLDNPSEMNQHAASVLKTCIEESTKMADGALDWHAINEGWRAKWPEDQDKAELGRAARQFLSNFYKNKTMEETIKGAINWCDAKPHVHVPEEE